MNTTPLDCVILDVDTPRYSVIWLHGLGADGHDFEPVAETLEFTHKTHTRFVFPHAPVRPVTINNGMAMRAWYDIRRMSIDEAQDAAGIRTSAAAIEQLIAAEAARGIPTGHIVLAGFSQGGAIALHTGLRYGERLAGIMALSTYLPLRDTFEAERHSANQHTPIFMGHGIRDNVVPESLGRATCKQLEQLGYAVEWHEYPMEHSVSLDEITDIGHWLERILTDPD